MRVRVFLAAALAAALCRAQTLSPTPSPSPSITPSRGPTPSASPTLPSPSRTASVTRSSASTPSNTRTPSPSRRASPAPNPAAAAVGWTFLAIFSAWAALLALTFGGAVVLQCQVVASAMCWAGAVPAMLGRALGVWAGTLALHGALLPAVNAALFFFGFALGAARRAAELGLLLARAFAPRARGCCGALPRHALPALPASFPRASPPAHRFVEGPPPPWWRDAGAGERAYRRAVGACCLRPCAYDDEGKYTFPCLPDRVAKLLHGCALLGAYLIVMCLQQGLLILLMIPLAAAVAAFLASLLYIPAGCCSVFVSCFQWEGHFYSVLPRVAERAGVVLGERAVDLLALGITAIALAPVYLVGVLSTRRVAFSPWALAWSRALHTGAAVPTEPPAGDGGARSDDVPPPPLAHVLIELPPLRAVAITTGSGRNILVHQAQAFYAPLGIANYSGGEGASIWNAGRGFYPPPPPPPPPGAATFMAMPRVASWRGSVQRANPLALVGAPPPSKDGPPPVYPPPWDARATGIAMPGDPYYPPPYPPPGDATWDTRSGVAKPGAPVYPPPSAPSDFPARDSAPAAEDACTAAAPDCDDSAAALPAARANDAPAAAAAETAEAAEGAAVAAAAPAAPAAPAVPLWPSFLCSVGELPVSLPQRLLDLVVARE